uniref:Lectin CBA n=1 Tax=Codium barbatum TaxID=221039 RepID=I0J0U4_9CHLO|nr:lectin CBA precursor [Codium barbatum]
MYRCAIVLVALLIGAEAISHGIKNDCGVPVTCKVSTSYGSSKYSMSPGQSLYRSYTNQKRACVYCWTGTDEKFHTTYICSEVNGSLTNVCSYAAWKSCSNTNMDT